MKALDLTEDQLLILDQYAPVIDMATIEPSTVAAVCPECGYYVLTTDTAPSKCQVTAGCSGKPRKVVAAVATRPVPAASKDEPAPAAEIIGTEAQAVEDADELEFTPEDLKQDDQELDFAPNNLDLSDVQLTDAEADYESFLEVVPAAKRAAINIYEDDDPSPSERVSYCRLVSLASNANPAQPT